MALTCLTPALGSEDHEASPLNYKARRFPTNTSCPVRGGWRKTSSDMPWETHLLCVPSQKAPRDVLRWNEGISQGGGEQGAQEGGATWEVQRRVEARVDVTPASVSASTTHWAYKLYTQDGATGSHTHGQTHVQTDTLALSLSHTHMNQQQNGQKGRMSNPAWDPLRAKPGVTSLGVTLRLPWWLSW